MLSRQPLKSFTVRLSLPSFPLNLFNIFLYLSDNPRIKFPLFLFCKNYFLQRFWQFLEKYLRIDWSVAFFFSSHFLPWFSFSTNSQLFLFNFWNYTSIDSAKKDGPNISRSYLWRYTSNTSNYDELIIRNCAHRFADARLFAVCYLQRDREVSLFLFLINNALPLSLFISFSFCLHLLTSRGGQNCSD